MDESAQQVPRRRPGSIGGNAVASWLLPGGVAIGAALTMALLAGVVRVPGEGNAAVGKPDSVPALTVTRLDWLPPGNEVRETLRLMDPTPLFMPDARISDTTAISAGIVDRPGGAVTEPFPAALAFPVIGPSREILRPTPPRTPLAAAELATASRWFNGLARADAPERNALEGPVALTTAGRMDIYRRGESKSTASVEIPADAILDAAIWRPMEFSVLINSAGMVAAPVVTVGSGVGEVDERMRVLVSQEIMPRLRLRPGAYRLVVGP